MQPRRGLRAGTDAILAAAAVPARAGDVVADLGAGVGTIGLCIAARVPGVRLHLVEIHTETAALARENAARNGAEATVHVMDAARLGLDGTIAQGSVDHVVCNPPFNAPQDRRSANPDLVRAMVSTPGLMEDWAKAAARILKTGGTFTVIHRPEALGEILAALDRRFGGVAVKAVHPAADKPAVRMLVQAVKAGRAPMIIAPPLILHGASGEFTPEVEALHRDGVALEMRS